MVVQDIRFFLFNQVNNLGRTDIQFIKPRFGVDVGALSSVKVMIIG